MKSDELRLLKLCRNCGKGGAIKQGVFRSRGKYILMVSDVHQTIIRLCAYFVCVYLG